MTEAELIKCLSERFYSDFADTVARRVRDADAVGLLYEVVTSRCEGLPRAVGRTTLTIAHRLTTIQHADRILVLGAQGIEEEGTHEQLLEKGGVYYRLWTGAKKLERATL